MQTTEDQGRPPGELLAERFANLLEDEMRALGKAEGPAARLHAIAHVRGLLRRIECVLIEQEHAAAKAVEVLETRYHREAARHH